MSTTELAMEFKKRNNKKLIGNQIGTVLSLNPFKVGLLDGELILYNCILTEQFRSLLDINNNGIKEVKINDKILVVCDDNSQTFFIIDRLEVM